MNFCLPFQGTYPITQKFGENPGSYSGFGLAGHNGVDYGVPNGTKILAAADGTVEKVGNDPNGYGIYVKLKHAEGYHTLYGHLREYVYGIGDTIVAGQLIGYSNNTGNSTGSHLHFEIRLDGQESNGYGGAVDPLAQIEGEIIVPNLELQPGARIRVICTALRIRDAYSTSTGQVVGLLYKGAKASAIDVYVQGEEVWVQISDGLWICYSYHGGQFCQVI